MSSDRPTGVGACFVTYNPDFGLLKRALRSIAGQVDLVFVVDNGSSTAEAVSKLSQESRCQFVSLGRNLGIAAAFNEAFRRAAAAGLTWLITCDQDSVMPQGMVDAFLSAAEHSDHGRLGIVCPNFQNRTTGRVEYSQEAPTLIQKCISSGAMTSISAWEEVGGFDEVMFIDGVDFDFCSRLMNAGLGILLVPNVCIEHEIGNAQVYRILGHEFIVFNHSAFRKYYIAQNIAYLDGKYRGGQVSPIAYLKFLKQVLLVLLYEDHKGLKVKRLTAGFLHGKQMCQTLRRDSHSSKQQDSE